MVRALIAVSLLLLLAAAPVSAADAVPDLTAAPTPIPLVVTGPPLARGTILPALYGALAGLQAYDGWSTVMGTRRGAVEANPVLAPVTSTPAAIWAAKGAATFASIYAAERLWKRHRRTEAIATMVAVNAIMASVAIHNRSVTRGME